MKQIRVLLANVRESLGSVKAVFVAAAIGLATSVHAALPPEAGAAFTTLKTDGESLVGQAWAPVAAVTVGFVLISLFKRAASKV